MNPLGARAGFDSPDLDRQSPPETYWPKPCEGRTCFMVETAASEQWKLAKIGLTLDEVLCELVEDLRREQEWAAEKGVRVPLEDLVVWQEGRAVALVRRRRQGDPQIVTFEFE